MTRSPRARAARQSAGRPGAAGAARGRDSQGAGAGPEPGSPLAAVLLLLDALPVIWLVLVLSAYALVALHPWMPTRREVGGVAEAERALPAVLLCLVGAAIIRYFLLKSTTPPASAASTPPPPSGGDRS